MDHLFPFGQAAGDSLLPSTDDEVAEVQLTASFPFFGRAEGRLFVRVLA